MTLLGESRTELDVSSKCKYINASTTSHGRLFLLPIANCLFCSNIFLPLDAPLVSHCLCIHTQALDPCPSYTNCGCSIVVMRPTPHCRIVEAVNGVDDSVSSLPAPFHYRISLCIPCPSCRPLLVDCPRMMLLHAQGLCMRRWSVEEGLSWCLIHLLALCPCFSYCHSHS